VEEIVPVTEKTAPETVEEIVPVTEKTAPETVEEITPVAVETAPETVEEIALVAMETAPETVEKLAPVAEEAAHETVEEIAPTTEETATTDNPNAECSGYTAPDLASADAEIIKSVVPDIQTNTGTSGNAKKIIRNSAADCSRARKNTNKQNADRLGGMNLETNKSEFQPHHAGC
ncbi:MAG: hypothetical protein IK130_06375, partial [Oscillospiraceae bacterium]|nr:hypothetical protein [Oscillospiraceae bacterium]